MNNYRVCINDLVMVILICLIVLLSTFLFGLVVGWVRRAKYERDHKLTVFDNK